MLSPADNCFVKLSLQHTLLFENCFVQLQTLIGGQLWEVKSDQGVRAGL